VDEGERESERVKRGRIEEFIDDNEEDL